MKRSAVELMLLASLWIVAGFVQGTTQEICTSYSYLVQPFVDPPCNPVLSSESILKLRCVVQTREEVDILWFLNVSEITSDAVETTKLGPCDMGYVCTQSELRLNRLAIPIGAAYKCAIRIDGVGSPIPPSEPFIPDHVSDVGCGSTVYTNQSKCVQPEVINVSPCPSSTIPLLQPPDTPALQVTSDLYNSPSSSSSVPRPSPMPPSPTHTVTDPSPRPSSVTPDPGLPPPSPSPSSTSSTTAVTEEDTLIWGLTTEMLLFITAGVAGALLLIILVLVVTCVAICCKKSQTVDTESLKCQDQATLRQRFSSTGSYPYNDQHSEQQTLSTHLSTQCISVEPPYDCTGERDYEVIPSTSSDYTRLNRFNQENSYSKLDFSQGRLHSMSTTAAASVNGLLTQESIPPALPSRDHAHTTLGSTLDGRNIHESLYWPPPGEERSCDIGAIKLELATFNGPSAQDQAAQSDAMTGQVTSSQAANTVGNSNFMPKLDSVSATDETDFACRMANPVYHVLEKPSETDSTFQDSDYPSASPAHNYEHLPDAYLTPVSSKKGSVSSLPKSDADGVSPSTRRAFPMCGTHQIDPSDIPQDDSGYRKLCRIEDDVPSHAATLPLDPSYSRLNYAAKQNGGPAMSNGTEVGAVSEHNSYATIDPSKVDPRVRYTRLKLGKNTAV